MMKMTDNSDPIFGLNVAEAWSRLYLRTCKPGADTLGSTMVLIKNSNSEEMLAGVGDCMVQKQIDNLLRGHNKPRTKETSEIIFPYAMWKAHGWNIDELTTWYISNFMPRLRAIAPAHLRNTYFERMVRFSEEEYEGSNQLKFVISACQPDGIEHKHFRQSGLQVSIFDPKRDHSKNPRQNFPCLQQVGFYFCSDKSLGISAFYPTQLIIERAFGNYLGLCQLGIFMAEQLGIRFSELACFIGSPRLGSGFKKDETRELTDHAQRCAKAAEDKAAESI